MPGFVKGGSGDRVRPAIAAPLGVDFGRCGGRGGKFIHFRARERDDTVVEKEINVIDIAVVSGGIGIVDRGAERHKLARGDFREVGDRGQNRRRCALSWFESGKRIRTRYATIFGVQRSQLVASGDNVPIDNP